VLVVTGTDDASRRIAAFSRGAFDFMLKPVDLPELVARLRRAVGFARDLKREHAMQESDALTGLYNRRGFIARLWNLLEDRRRGALSVAMIDQDGLKAINDRWGHAAGDAAIVQVASALKATQRTTDVAARFGGDEFALLMPDTDLAGAARLLERVQAALDTHPLPLAPVPVVVSWGIAQAEPAEGLADAEGLLERADVALYAMKRGKQAAARS
jgi:diguanylate cyclase (GGDEF)-like protein